MSTDLPAIAAALRGVPGVVEAAVEPDESGEVGSVRVVLDPGVDGLETASSLSRLLHDQLSTEGAPEHVHVVDDVTPLRHPVPTAEVAPAKPARTGGRPTIVRTGQVVADLEVTATVVLSSGERFATGEAHSAASEQGSRRVMSAATLRALEHLVRDAARFDLDHLEVLSSGGVRTVVVSLTMVSAGGTERLTGATAVREDEGRAVVRATLDAVNRRLETLLG